jgi:hypothetical protein
MQWTSPGWEGAARKGRGNAPFPAAGRGVLEARRSGSVALGFRTDHSEQTHEELDET